MKKNFLFACLMLLGTAAFAQKAEMGVGLNLNYGLHSDYKNFGFGGKFQYTFSALPLRAEASANYFLKKDECTMWDINANVHYLFGLGDKLRAYPIFGVTLLGSKVSMPAMDYGYGVEVEGEDASDTNVGINAGAGIEYQLTNNLYIGAEVKYQIVKDWDRPVVSVGLTYVL